MSGCWAQLHSGVGTGAGAVLDDKGRRIHLVCLHFAKDPAMLEALESGDCEFDPEDNDLWHNFALSIRAARQLISDLQECVDAAIEGPPQG